MSGKPHTFPSLSSENLPFLSHSSTLSGSDIAKDGASLLLGAFHCREPEAASLKALEKNKDNQSDVPISSGTNPTFLSFMKTNESSSAHLVTSVTSSLSETMRNRPLLRWQDWGWSKTEAEVKAQAEAQAKQEAYLKAKAEAASAFASSAGTIILPSLTSLNSKVDILADITKELVGQMGEMIKTTLPSLTCIISTNTSNLSLYKEATTKLIEGQSKALIAQ